jgi:hypothetical protein
MVARLLGHEPGRRGTFAIGSSVTENTGLPGTVISEV